jgi:hypothetical protein
VELLSNRVLALFLLRIDGEINGVARELNVCQWRKREKSFGLFLSVLTIGEEESRCGGQGKVYIPPASQRSLKLPLFRCGTAAPTKTAKDGKG